MPRAVSALEARFDAAWEQAQAGFPAPVADYRFHATRKWELDRAWPAAKVAVELEGGSWGGGRHTRGSGYEKDCEKYNTAAVEGWLVLRFTTSMLRESPERCLAWITRALEQRHESISTTSAGLS